MAAIVEGVAYTSLQGELEKAKENLKSVDENIKKLTGRVPYENRIGGQNQGPNRRALGGGISNRGQGRPQDFTPGDRQRDADLPPAKRRALTIFSRLEGRNRRPSRDEPWRKEEDSGEEDELPTKPTVQSSVVAHPKEQKTRKDCIDEQKPDEKGLARNRRMFGLLMGTLQKFRVEEQQKQHKEQKRVEIEKKLEDKVEREREDLKKERKELFLERRKRQAELRRLEFKMELAKQLEDWVQNRKRLSNFICTKASPSIYYLPAKHNDVTLRLLDESKKNIEVGIEVLRKAVEEEIENVGKRRAVAVDTEMEVEVGDQVRLGFNATTGSGDAGVDPSQASEINLNMEGQEDIMGEMYEESSGSFPMLIPLDQAPNSNAVEGDQVDVVEAVVETKKFENAEVETTEEKKEVAVETMEQAAAEEVVAAATTESAVDVKAENSEQQGIPLQVKNDVEMVSVEKNEKEIPDEQEIDAIDINKLAEKEFEPIYD